MPERLSSGAGLNRTRARSFSQLISLVQAGFDFQKESNPTNGLLRFAEVCKEEAKVLCE